MKPSKYLPKAVMLLLFTAAVAYFGVYAYHIFFASYETAVIYQYEGQHTMSASGYIIREETVLQDGGNLEEIAVAEGENVAAGDIVARVYRSEQALERHRELERLKTQLARMEYIRQRGSDESDAMRMNAEIVDAMTNLRGSVGRGSFTRLDEQVNLLQELVFRRDYTFSEDSALNGEIETLKAQVSELEEETESASSTVYSPAAGIYSAVVDGWEESFDLETLEELTPATLREAAKQHTNPTGSELGKVITSFRWYYAAVMDGEITKHLNQGDKIDVHFEGSVGRLPMTVQFITSPDEHGEVLVLFTSMRDVPLIAPLRIQNVEIGMDSASGLRIPTRALRADQETNQLGVYRLTGTQAEWVPVDLLFSGGDYYLVRSHVEGELDQLQQAKLLRSGDEVLVRGLGISDGKVIE